MIPWITNVSHILLSVLHSARHEQLQTNNYASILILCIEYILYRSVWVRTDNSNYRLQCEGLFFSC